MHMDTQNTCDSCSRWGVVEDRGTFRICLIRNEHVSCDDSCKFYIQREEVDEKEVPTGGDE